MKGAGSLRSAGENMSVTGPYIKVVSCHGVIIQDLHYLLSCFLNKVKANSTETHYVCPRPLPDRLYSALLGLQYSTILGKTLKDLDSINYAWYLVLEA